MSGPCILIAHSLKRVRALVLMTAGLLAVFQLALIVMAKAFHRSTGFAGLADLLPPIVREFFGPSLAGFLSFGGMVSQIYFHPLVLCALVAVTISISTIPTREIESGFVDLILSRPIARHWIITRTILVAVICIVSLVGAMLTATWAGLYIFGPKEFPWPSPRLILSLGANLGMLMLCWSGVAMAIGSACRRRGFAGAITGFLALPAFLLDYVGRVWPAADAVAWLSPFSYASGLDLLMGASLHWMDVLVLGVIALAGFILAYFLFLRRDLSR
jgi:ABC-type transport system involved in multi-copper enzyme maturation permease subunit